MRRQLFQKAKYLTNNKKVKVEGETDYSIRVSVGEYDVVFKYQNHDLIFLCSCRQGAFNKLCSHVIAGMSYLSK